MGEKSTGENGTKSFPMEEILKEMAHQFGNHLHIIGGRVRLLLRKMPDDPYLEQNLEIISTQVEQMARLIQDLLETVNESRGGESLDP